ncbi:hypothetical protein Anas_03802, partial [Armadillidium nasatum]
TCNELCKDYFRKVIAYACGSSIILGVLGLFTLIHSDIGRKKFYNEWAPSTASASPVAQRNSNSLSNYLEISDDTGTNRNNERNGDALRRKSDYTVVPVTEEEVDCPVTRRCPPTEPQNDRSPLIT